MEECNCVIALAKPRHKPPFLVFKLDNVKWRGTIFMYCPICRKQNWKWVTKHDKKLGTYKIKERIV